MFAFFWIWLCSMFFCFYLFFSVVSASHRSLNSASLSCCLGVTVSPCWLLLLSEVLLLIAVFFLAGLVLLCLFLVLLLHILFSLVIALEVVSTCFPCLLNFLPFRFQSFCYPPLLVHTHSNLAGSSNCNPTPPSHTPPLQQAAQGLLTTPMTSPA